MVEKSKLDEDPEGKAVDPSHYHEIIGTLLYLTANRPDLQFLLFPYSDHAGCQDTRHSTFGSMQLLGDRLSKWRMESYRTLLCPPKEYQLGKPYSPKGFISKMIAVFAPPQKLGNEKRFMSERNC
ncbi:hypothetical protein Tco_0779185 [Tanacetum coccineum]